MSCSQSSCQSVNSLIYGKVFWPQVRRDIEVACGILEVSFWGIGICYQTVDLVEAHLCSSDTRWESVPKEADIVLNSTCFNDGSCPPGQCNK